MDSNFLSNRFTGEEFCNGTLIIARRVVERDGNIDGDRILAHQDDALEEFVYFLMMGVDSQGFLIILSDNLETMLDKCIFFSTARVVDQYGPVNTLEHEQTAGSRAYDPERMDQGRDVLERSRAT